MSLYQLFSERTRANKPVALATVIDGPNIGAMLLVTPDDAARCNVRLQPSDNQSDFFQVAGEVLFDQ